MSTQPYIRQAILTRYHAATNTRGSYLTAEAERGRIRIDWNDELSIDQNHLAAAEAFKARAVAEDKTSYGTTPEQNPWSRPTTAGALPGGSNRGGIAHTYDTRTP